MTKRALRQTLAVLAAICCAATAHAERPGGRFTADAFFANAPLLPLEQTGPITLMPYMHPVIFAPSSGRNASDAISCYIGSIGKLVEIPLATDEVIEHPMPFDHETDDSAAGAYAAWLGPDDCIYLSMQTKPGTLARFNLAERTMEQFHLDAGWGAHHCAFGPNGKAYFATYLATVIELDMKTGAVRNLGRMSESQVYIWSNMWVGADGYFYCAPGSQRGEPVRVDLATGEVVKLDRLPERTPHPDTPTVKHANLTRDYDVAMNKLPERVTVTISRKKPKGDPAASEPAAPIRTAVVVPSNTATNLSTLIPTPDGRIYGSGLHRHFIFDPATRLIERPNIQHSVADMIVAGSRVYMCGYPNAMLAVLDTSRPLTVPFDGSAPAYLSQLNGPDDNPRFIVALRSTADSSHPAKALLLVNRLWSIEQAPDGRIFMGATASRGVHGGALSIWNPADGTVTSWRAPVFESLGVRALCPVNNWKQLAIATWVSEDPLKPQEAPAEARLFLFDVERNTIEWSGVPLPGCKVLVGIIPAPGTNRLIGVGLRGVNPTDKDDDSFYDDAHVFIFDLDERRTVADFPLDFRLGQREGRPLVVAPDGTVWAAGGIGGSVIAGPHDGGILRIDATKLTITPVARCDGPVGNFTFIGNTIYMVGGKSLRFGDVTSLLRPGD